MAVVRELTEQLVIMEEGPTADRIRAAATVFELSISEVCRLAIRRGLVSALRKLANDNPVGASRFDAEVERLRIERMDRIA